MRSRGNIPVNNLPENPREDVREESLSERMDPAVEEFGKHIVVRVELLQIVISELVCWNVARWWFPRSIPCFDSSEVSSSTRSLKKRIPACHNDDEQAVNIGDVCSHQVETCSIGRSGCVNYDVILSSQKFVPYDCQHRVQQFFVTGRYRFIEEHLAQVVPADSHEVRPVLN